MDEPRFVEVYWARATSVDLLRHVCGLLEEAGIEPRLVKEEDHLGDWIAGPASGAGFRIWVCEGDEPRARQVIAQWEGRRELEAPAAAWQCQQCGEEVEGNFDICWNCQSSRGSTGPEHAASGGASESDGGEPTLAIPFEGPSAEPAAGSKPTRIGPLAASVIFVGWFLGEVCGVFAGYVTGANTPVTMLYGIGGGAIALILLTQWCLGGSIQERGRQKFGLVGASLAQTALGGLAGGLLAIVSLAVELWILPVPPDAPQDAFTQMANSSGFGFVTWAFIAIALAPPIEEFAFRGVMLHGFSQRWGRRTAAIIVTLLFVVMHLSESTLHYWPTLLFITLLGVLAVVVRLRSGSLIPALAAHLSYNMTIVGSFLGW